MMLGNPSAVSQAVDSIRNAVLLTEAGEEFLGGTGTSGSYVLITGANSFNSFRKVLAFPFQVRG